MPDLIYKHRLDHLRPVTLSLPRDFRVVLVAAQDGAPFIWIRQPVRPDTKVVTCTFSVSGTGHPFDSAAVHVGSFQDGPYVWHVLQV